MWTKQWNHNIPFSNFTKNTCFTCVFCFVAIYFCTGLQCTWRRTKTKQRNDLLCLCCIILVVWFRIFIKWCYWKLWILIHRTGSGLFFGLYFRRCCCTSKVLNQISLKSGLLLFLLQQFLLLVSLLVSLKATWDDWVVWYWEYIQDYC